MDARSRIERALDAAVGRAGGPGAPPKLAAAMRDAVFPGGARIRPRLCLAVAAACGDDDPPAADAAAAAIELLHCASLVHDDLPAFDDAPIRRGKPTVHAAFGEPVAVLAGDALIVLAFETLALGADASPARLAGLIAIVAGATGAPDGIAAGQAWESEGDVDLARYHQSKTGALFAAATRAGALAAGTDPAPWGLLGARLGEAFQVADDIRDVVMDAAALGKPAGQDAVHDRPSAARTLGPEGALALLDRLLGEAIAAIPPCPGRRELEALLLVEARRFVPRGVVRHAA